MRRWRWKQIAAAVVLSGILAWVVWPAGEHPPRLEIAIASYTRTNQPLFLVPLDWEIDDGAPTRRLMVVSDERAARRAVQEQQDRRKGERHRTVPPVEYSDVRVSSETILARVTLTNRGRQPLFLEKSTGDPITLEMQIHHAGVTNEVYQFGGWRGGNVMLHPGEGTELLARLPPDTEFWRVGCRCGNPASVRVFADRHPTAAGYLEKAFERLPDLVTDRIVPDDDPYEHEIWSERWRVPPPKARPR